MWINHCIIEWYRECSAKCALNLFSNFIGAAETSVATGMTVTANSCCYLRSFAEVDVYSTCIGCIVHVSQVNQGVVYFHIHSCFYTPTPLLQHLIDHLCAAPLYFSHFMLPWQLLLFLSIGFMVANGSHAQTYEICYKWRQWCQSDELCAKKAHRDGLFVVTQCWLLFWCFTVYTCLGQL